MEKRKPHYDLEQLKEFFCTEQTRRITEQAITGATTLGYMIVEAMLDVIDQLRSKHFYKSMTVYHNPQLWQDVYKITDKDNDLYIKLQLDADREKAVLVQFKRDEGGDL